MTIEEPVGSCFRLIPRFRERATNVVGAAGIHNDLTPLCSSARYLEHDQEKCARRFSEEQCAIQRC